MERVQAYNEKKMHGELKSMKKGFGDEERNESIVLMGATKMKRFKVFSDAEVGIGLRFRRLVHESVKNDKFRLETRTTQARRRSLSLESRSAISC